MSNSFDPADQLKKLGLDMPEEVPSEEIFGDGADVLHTSLDAEYIDGQADPDGKDAHEAGAKLDAGKVPMWQGVFSYFANALVAVGFISEFGSRKYTWGGWKTVEDGHARYSSALGRHLLAEATGERYDPETGMLHSAQVAWNALARLELELKEHPLRDPKR